MQNMHEKLAHRWVGYFDLLGTSDLIRSGKLLNAFNNYLDSIKKLEQWKKDKPNISHAWFSDTFILFSDDDSGKSFTDIEQTCRWFMFALLRRNIPIRGALACGQFYAEKSNSLYIGPALLEAYEWGENQNWIGYLLCPSSVNKLSELGLQIEESLNYALYNVPYKKKPGNDSPAAVCILGNWIRSSENRIFLLDKLKEMAGKQRDKKVRLKYERTIRFIKKYEKERWPLISKKG